MTGVNSTHDSLARDAIAALEATCSCADVVHQDRIVRWRTFGEGSPLVLLHGGHGSWLHWFANIAHLAQGHRVLVPNIPGFLDSDDPPAPSDGQDALAPMVDMLAGTLRELVDDTPVDLAGFSFGGLVATRLAVHGRVAVRKLALLGVAGHGTARRSFPELRDWRAESRPEAVRDALAHNLRALMLHNPLRADALALAIHQRSCEATRFRSRSISRAGGLQALLEGFHEPLLFLWGELDVTAVPGELAEQLRADRPEREWCLLPGAGHWAQYENAEDVNRLLARWFAASEA